MNITNVLGRLRRMTSKQVVTAGVFAIALAGAVGLGLAVKQDPVRAANVRDTGHNPIMNVSPAGCLTKDECISKMRTNNPGDLQGIYTYFGLAPNEYDRFLQTARLGKVMKSGEIIVDGQVVATGAWSTGRDKFNTQREAYTIPGVGTYYKSPTTASFASNSIDAFVMFDNNGTVEFSLLTACGNAVWGNKVVPHYSCDKLTKTPVAGKKNTYTFKTDATAVNNASIVRVEYDFGDGTKYTAADASVTPEHTYTKPGKYTAKVKVIVKVPGNQEKEATGISCQTDIEVVAPYYACTKLMAQTNDVKKQKFSFTAVTNYGNGAVLKDASFTFDGKVTVEGVQPNSDNKTITIDRTFTDSATHTVLAKVNFNIDNDVTSVTCETQVTSEKTPVCIIEGKPYPNEENPYPPEDERCKKPEVPNTPPPELPKTGPGSMVGLFAGTSMVGAAAHRVFQGRRKANRSKKGQSVDYTQSGSF